LFIINKTSIGMIIKILAILSFMIFSTTCSIVNDFSEIDLESIGLLDIPIVREIAIDTTY
jgi:hypothetical protein